MSSAKNHPITHQTRVIFDRPDHINHGLSRGSGTGDWRLRITLQEGIRTSRYSIPLRTPDVHTARERRDRLVRAIESQSEVMRRRHSLGQSLTS